MAGLSGVFRRGDALDTMRRAFGRLGSRPTTHLPARRFRFYLHVPGFALQAHTQAWRHLRIVGGSSYPVPRRRCPGGRGAALAALSATSGNSAGRSAPRQTGSVLGLTVARIVDRGDSLAGRVTCPWASGLAHARWAERWPEYRRDRACPRASVGNGREATTGVERSALAGCWVGGPGPVGDASPSKPGGNGVM